MDKQKPRVSIGLPVFNGEDYLDKAINSILAQTYSDFELIISDNASTDGTQTICEAYAAKEHRIHYYRHETNRGAAWNYNYAFSRARGDYFKWVPHDDMHAPEYLERCVAILDQHPTVVLCYPQTVIIDENGQELKKYIDGLNLRSPKAHERYELFQEHYRFGTGALCNAILGLTRTKLLQTTPLIGSYSGSDIVLLGELVLLGEIYEISEALFFRRSHPQSHARVTPDYNERAAWFDPTKKGKISLTTWRWFFEYSKSLNRVKLERSEKIRCYKRLAKWFRWHWSVVLRPELKMAALKILKGQPLIVWLSKRTKKMVILVKQTLSRP